MVTYDPIYWIKYILYIHNIKNIIKYITWDICKYIYI